MQYLHQKPITLLGWSSGAVCGMAAITPGAGYVPLWSSLIIGLLGGVCSYHFCHYKSKLCLFAYI
jgi:Amt family ammonium transporter